MVMRSDDALMPRGGASMLMRVRGGDRYERFDARRRRACCAASKDAAIREATRAKARASIFDIFSARAQSG